jgi:glucose/arabinose dehydrogenase
VRGCPPGDSRQIDMWPTAALTFGWLVQVLMRYRLLVLGLAFATPVLAANPDAGRTLFSQQCALCHSAAVGDNGGSQGPSLIGVFGRRAASNSQFTYTTELKASGLTWDAATLDRFLTAPSVLVPGTAMAAAVPAEADRANLIAYFQGVSEGSYTPATEAQRVRVPTAIPTSGGDWRKDRPGRAHRVELAKLPQPGATESATNFPKLIDRPSSARLAVPKGFHVDVFTKEVKGPRAMRLAPNGDVFLSEERYGRIMVMHPAADGATAASVEVFAQGLNLPFGMAFYPTQNPQWLYVAETNRVVRYAYKVGDQKASGLPEVVIPQLHPVPGTSGHITRDIVFSQDDKRMFVSVGSLSNVGDTMPVKSTQEVGTWQRGHALGAAWGPEENRADVLVFDVGSKAPGRVYASGIRNCAGLTIQPATGDLWCTTNERDRLGDDLVPDYSTRVREGAFYGWPWYYMGNHEDPRRMGERPDLAGKVSVPDVPYTSHSAALNLVFYTATRGASAFPSEYVGDAFAAFHGSWNRSFRTGHKIVRVRMKNGVPTGEYDDFLVGFIATNGDAWGRPVGLVVCADGSLLFSDDGADVVYRISYRPKAR